MSTFNIRYGGQIESLKEGPYYNDNYGTAKLNIKVNSTSTLKFGLTTNTSAQEYCHFSIRIGGQTAYIGKVIPLYVYQTHLTSGQQHADSKAYNDYLLGSSSSVYSDKYAVAVTGTIAERPRLTDYYTHAISQTTEVTNTVTIITSEETYTSTSAPGYGIKYSSADPGIKTEENSTGSTVTYATTSEQLSTPWYSFSVYDNVDEYRSEYSTISRGWPAAGNNKVFTYSRTRQMKTSQELQYYAVRGTDYKQVYNDYKNYTKITSAGDTAYGDWSTYQQSTTLRISGTTASNVTTASTAGGWATIKISSQNWAFTEGVKDVDWDNKWSIISRSQMHTFTSKITSKGSVYTTSKTLYNTRQTRSGYNTWGNRDPQAIKTMYLYATTYTYSTSSCEKYTDTSYYTEEYYQKGTSYTTSYSHRYATVTQTMHNMNI